MQVRVTVAINDGRSEARGVGAAVLDGAAVEPEEMVADALLSATGALVRHVSYGELLAAICRAIGLFHCPGENPFYSLGKINDKWTGTNHFHDAVVIQVDAAVLLAGCDANEVAEAVEVMRRFGCVSLINVDAAIEAAS